MATSPGQRLGDSERCRCALKGKQQKLHEDHHQQDASIIKQNGLPIIFQTPTNSPLLQTEQMKRDSKM